MGENQDAKRSFWQRLKVRYHLSIVNKNLLIEVYSRNISLGRLILWIIASTFSVSLLTYLIIAFTPIKSYIIPGYESASDHAHLIENTKQLFKRQEKVQNKIEYGLKLDSTFKDFGIPQVQYKSGAWIGVCIKNSSYNQSNLNGVVNTFCRSMGYQKSEPFWGKFFHHEHSWPFHEEIEAISRSFLSA